MAALKNLFSFRTIYLALPFFNLTLPVFADSVMSSPVSIQDHAIPNLGCIVGFELILADLVLVSIVIFFLIFNISMNLSTRSTTYFSHGPNFEIFWTMVPAAILLIIAYPCFKMLDSANELTELGITSALTQSSLLALAPSVLTLLNCLMIFLSQGLAIILVDLIQETYYYLYWHLIDNSIPLKSLEAQTGLTLKAIPVAPSSGSTSLPNSTQCTPSEVNELSPRSASILPTTERGWVATTGGLYILAFIIRFIFYP